MHLKPSTSAMLHKTVYMKLISRCYEENIWTNFSIDQYITSFLCLYFFSSLLITNPLLLSFIFDTLKHLTKIKVPFKYHIIKVDVFNRVFKFEISC